MTLFELIEKKLRFASGNTESWADVERVIIWSVPHKPRLDFYHHMAPRAVTPGEAKHLFKNVTINGASSGDDTLPDFTVITKRFVVFVDHRQHSAPSTYIGPRRTHDVLTAAPRQPIL